jgi:mono/diheme cytochrome c family protein
MRAARNWLAGVGALGAAGILVAALAGCGVGSSTADTSLANGKQLFVARCGTCHVLSRAGTKGVVGPNLDQAFQQAIKDGIRRSTIRGLVREQIDHPIPGSGMPADVVKGQNARDVAAYVSSVASARGKDTGLLATLGQQQAKGSVAAKNGTLEIDAAAAGLAYVAKSATAPAGKLTIKSKNPQPVGHDIALEGNGVNAKGAVVQNGGVSQFSADLKPGKYTFYCSVPGHRQGGMVGTITVK